MVAMTTNVPSYARCDAGTCPGHEYNPDDVTVFGAALPPDLDDRGAEVAMALVASVALTYGTEREGCEYDPTIGIHKGPMTRLDAREWIATVVRSTP
jgi:hypothetical protein